MLEAKGIMMSKTQNTARVLPEAGDRPGGVGGEGRGS